MGVIPSVDLRAGKLYLPAALAERHFAGVTAVILLVRDGCLLVLPVRRTESGGSVLKIRNAAGDRVVAAPDVLGAHGLEDRIATDLHATWSEELGALVVDFAK